MAEFELDGPQGLPFRVFTSHIRTSSIRHRFFSVFADRRYEPYLVRQHAEIKRQAEIEHRRLPDANDYDKLTHLRTDARQALTKFRPRTFGQAGRLEGLTPADLDAAVGVGEQVRERRLQAPMSAPEKLAKSPANTASPRSKHK